ncbi:hypothetical protein [Singulisphaera sp. PoT]|uniref:hypothetical protein n=1 Tax=Singulisphaera sp. PoT TaxID=3411797 RepID=UPI003BF5FCCC
MNWRWTAKKVLISVFILAHCTAVVTWVLPVGPLRNFMTPTTGYYMLPLGLWQYWAMFAPDPIKDTCTLEAEVVDAKGMRHNFAFPKMADYTVWQGIPRFRYSKYTANMVGEGSDINRKFAARHAVRSLGLKDEAFPMDVHLFYQVRPTPEPGGPPADPMTPTRPELLTTFQFASLEEVRP